MLNAEMKSGLRQLLEGNADSVVPGTVKSLKSVGFVDANSQLTHEGWKRAVLISRLPDQCAHLKIDYEKLEGLRFKKNPERAAWRYFCRQGHVGSYCEGGALLLLIRCAALETLVELNPFQSHQDACVRFTEAQLTIHENHLPDILATIKYSDADSVARAFREIYRSRLVREACPGLKEESVVALYNIIGANQLRELTDAIAEDPYEYRKGWPDLTLATEDRLFWIEVKTTDKLHMSQITTIHRMKSLMPGTIQVAQLC